MRNRHTNRGGAMIEFIFITPVWVSLLLGTMWIGSAMVRGLQVTQVARDAASMFCRGVDFSASTGNANDTLTKLTQELGTITSSGTGVVIFSVLTYVGNGVCAQLGSTYGTAGNNTPGNTGSHTGSCTNYGKFVFTQRYTVGNSGLRTSNFGAPATADPDSNNYYKITTLNYVTHTTDVSTFNLLPAPHEDGTDGYQSGQSIYLVEAYFPVAGGQPGYTQGGTYAYAVF
jgi:Flp pilus assembly protein TadG